MHSRISGWLALPLALALTTAAAAEPADRILTGATVVTVNAAQPSAAAIAIRDGKIVAVGTTAEVLQWQGPQTQVDDLSGRTILPGFIDAHGHITMQARIGFMRNIAPAPVGTIRNITDLQREMRIQVASPITAITGWVLGFGYDDSLLTEKRHPTRSELDAVSTEKPVVVLHASLHLASANSKALALAGITAATPNPPGGVIRRRAGSQEPDGVLEETAMHMLLGALPAPNLDQTLLTLAVAQQEYAKNGITTAQEGAADAATVAMLEEAARRDMLKIDVIAFPIWRDADQALAGRTMGQYSNRFKIGGIKLVLDGSPQGKTAFLTHPYHQPPAGLPEDYRGYPMLPAAEVESYVAEYAAKGWPLLAHANGDAAADILIAAVGKVADERKVSDHRTVMIHAQTVREDQLDQMVELGIIPSFFVAHTFYWGDWHRDSVLGRARAEKISPAHTAGRKGLRYTFHNDSPVVPPHMTRLIWTGVNRTTRSGQTLGWQERVTPLEAIQAVTIHAARQNFEENEKGSIEVGKLADLVVLDGNPLEVAPETIDQIAVVETIKEGKTIYPQPKPAKKKARK
ncbi:MAG: amidohydrolase [Deltaproteobacteria bacterium]